MKGLWLIESQGSVINGNEWLIDSMVKVVPYYV